MTANALPWVDFVLAVFLAELVFFGAWAWWQRQRGAARLPTGFLTSMLSGLCLVLVLRGALLGLPLPVLLAGLAAAGLCHAAYLWRVLRRR